MNTNMSSNMNWYSALHYDNRETLVSRLEHATALTLRYVALRMRYHALPRAATIAPQRNSSAGQLTH
jgi:hypothetical protein